MVIVQFTDYGNALANSWIEDVRFWEDLPFTTEMLETALKEKGLEKATIGMELSLELHLAIPHNDFVDLTTHLPNASFVDAAALIWKLRMVKSEAEVALIRQAAQITASSLQECLPKVETGMTEREVSKMISLRLLEKGADKVNYVSAIAGEGTYDQFCQLPTDRPIQTGELVWSDLSCIYRDYCSDMSSFTVVGEPNDQQKRHADLARSVHFKALDMIRPQITGWQVMEFVARCYIDAGFDWNFKIGRCGHGVGLELAEQPSIDAHCDVVLKPGMTLAFEPAILAGCGVFDMEEDIVITEEGCDVLGPVWPR